MDLSNINTATSQQHAMKRIILKQQVAAQQACNAEHLFGLLEFNLFHQ